jgi:DNA polymerase-3 subunit alpha
LATGRYDPISSLGELEDRASFRVAGAIAQVDRKFTKREGKPFAVVWLEDMSGTLEVVLWNEVYVKVAEALQPGRVIAITGTLDRRDDGVRATAQKVKVLLQEPLGGASPNESTTSSIILKFGVGTTAGELREVKEMLAAHPGQQSVQLFFERLEGPPALLDLGDQLRVDFTAELQAKLAPWLREEMRESAAVN